MLVSPHCPSAKRRYRTWTKAEAVLKKIKRRTKHRTEVQVYHCCECSGFHLTSQKTRRGAA